MNPIRDDLERLSFSQSEKEALTAALTAAGAERVRPMPMAYRRIIALVAVVSLLIGAVGAVSVAGISPGFRAFFGIETAEQEERLQPKTIHQVYEDPNGTGTVLTVEQVLMDSRNLYVTMDLAAPEGTVLPQVPEALELGESSYWVSTRSESAGSMSAWLTQDAEGAQNWDGAGSMSYGFTALPDENGAGNHISLVFQLTLYGSTFDETCQYLHIGPISQLNRYNPAAGCYDQIALEGFHFSVVIPLEGSRVEQYDFQGRSLVQLGGDTLALMDNLSLSPICLSFDLLCGSEDQYNALSEGLSNGGWPVYVLLRDGTRVDASFPGNFSFSHYAAGEDTGIFFAAASLSLQLEHPIDPAEVDDIIFVGDNGDETGRYTDTPKRIYFSFDPNWRNDHYWNEVNALQMERNANRDDTSDLLIQMG
ncbi:DUF4179 domain-containing protein [Pseudoflavonifractor phocaeensis]|uniref:DUF4179 domain-containing protein n=1 Tax=Pseudoflavonifractor phocaeensis TaxID=1870988 RepID=UPI00195E4B7C|nr:DUF4179 domain-containing protein [Pseudoflavonifractor phocaeensis]MBM6938088.1 DUF4179 domain-containing protein [Pseudoflavonifractor phocaeensis]